MTVSAGLSHVAVSVAPGTLNDAYRAEVLAFYGDHFGWREIDELRLPYRLTLAVGNHCYVNVRERPEAMVCHGYEHFGLLVPSADAAEDTCGSARPRGPGRRPRADRARR